MRMRANAIKYSPKEMELISLLATKVAYKSDLEREEQMDRQLQGFKLFPEAQSESILFHDADIDAEMKRVKGRIIQLSENIVRINKLIFHHKLKHGKND